MTPDLKLTIKKLDFKKLISETGFPETHILHYDLYFYYYDIVYIFNRFEAIQFPMNQ